MFSSLERRALAALLGLCVVFGAGAQTQTGAASAPSAKPSNTTHAAEARPQPAAASAPAEKKKHASRAKTPPGKPPGGEQCNQGDKAQRQRCLNDMYGPGGPRL